jgi:hypothetical protein
MRAATACFVYGAVATDERTTAKGWPFMASLSTFHLFTSEEKINQLFK